MNFANCLRWLDLNPQDVWLGVTMIKDNGDTAEKLRKLMHDASNQLAIALSYLRKVRKLTGPENSEAQKTMEQLSLKLDELTKTNRDMKLCLHQQEQPPFDHQHTPKQMTTSPTENLCFDKQIKDKSYRVFNWMASPDPGTGLFHATINDITAMQSQESQLTQIITALDKSAIVTSTDRQGTILTVNDNFCSISGYNRNELIGQNHRILNSGVHSPRFFRDLWRTILAGQVWSGEIVNQRKDGSHYIVQSVISPMLSLDGKLERFLSVRFDVTKLRESERLLTEAQRVAKIGSWSFNIKTQNFSCSNQMHEIFPDFSESLMASPYEQFCSTIHPDDLKHWQAGIAKCIETQKPFRLRFRRQQTSDQTIWLEVLGQASLDNSQSVAIISGTCQDVTELVEAEEQSRFERQKSLHNAKLASLGEMYAGIAHEINNPLTIIDACIRSINKYSDDVEKVKAKAELVKKASGRINKIVSGLRKFSRASEHSDRKPHTLAKIIDEAIVLTSSKANRHATPVHIKLESGLQVICDEIEIEQVLVNLINNAIDAVKLLKEKWIKIDLFDQDSFIVLQIRDSGQGISSEHREKLFQPFFTTKVVGEGTGLGLSIVKGLLEQNNATIEVLANDPNTCFEIRFCKLMVKDHVA